MTAQQPKKGKPLKVVASRKRKPLWKIRKEMKVPDACREDKT
jgi:hypothetical protein